jgi:hypothetical protein
LHHGKHVLFKCGNTLTPTAPTIFAQHDLPKESTAAVVTDARPGCPAAETGGRGACTRTGRYG